MTYGRQVVVSVVATGLLLGVGCRKQKQRLAVNMQAPTIVVEVVPNQIPEIALPTEPPPAQQEATVAEPPPKKTPQKRHKKPATAPATQSTAANQANTAVAANRPPVNPALETTIDKAIAADVSSQTLTHQKETTAQWLESAEKNLKAVKHELSPDEEKMVTQIKSYITQSRNATRDGDYERAYNLAQKAHLLADALVKQ